MSFKKSPWVFHYDGSSCNGCDIEVIACLSPVYDIERLGVLNTGNPKHADILLITGAVNEQNKPVVMNIYEQMPSPRVVVAIGVCATSGGIFAECYNTLGGVDRIIPVDVYVTGCAARPEAIIDGIKKALGVLEKKKKKLEEMSRGLVEIKIEAAAAENTAEIHALQKLAHRSEAEMHNDPEILTLSRSHENIKEEIAKTQYYKAVMHEKIIGLVGAYRKNDTCFIENLIVNPLYQHHGIGRRLVEHVIKDSPGSGKFRAWAFSVSRQRIMFYQGLKFRPLKRDKLPDGREKVILEKTR